MNPKVNQSYFNNTIIDGKISMQRLMYSKYVCSINIDKIEYSLYYFKNRQHLAHSREYYLVKSGLEILPRQRIKPDAWVFYNHENSSFRVALECKLDLTEVKQAIINNSYLTDPEWGNFNGRKYT